eukprot:TRINITY_DN59958_c0_g1_i1.p1 TRINITY_DN59958_c0_g1~~TRINITY_DN59958_c0_g1_i1.p1  ORF type:complete len:1377 (+),score=323.48 TRINITY_DN59958_c0_g1_i1:77-4207(+)
MPGRKPDPVALSPTFCSPGVFSGSRTSAGGSPRDAASPLRLPVRTGNSAWRQAAHSRANERAVLEAVGSRVRALEQEHSAKLAEVAELQERLAAAQQEAAALSVQLAVAAEDQARKAMVEEEYQQRAQACCFNPARAERWRQIGRLRLGALRGGKSYEYYEKLAERPGASDEQIAKDMPRTLGGIRLLKERHGEASEARIRCTLRAWVARSESEGSGCGYVQGMNNVCAVPCLVMAGCDPAEIFGVCLAALEDVAMPDTYAAWPMLVGLTATRAVLVEEVATRLPRFAEAIGGKTVLDQLLTLLVPSWLLCLWGPAMAGPVLLRLWDEMLECVAQSLQQGCSETPHSSPGTRGTWHPATVPLRWAVSLIASLEDQVLDALAPGAERSGLEAEHIAFQILRDGVLQLPPDFEPPATGPWDMQSVLRRHATMVQELKAEAEPKRLGSVVSISEDDLRHLRAEFEKLRGSALERRRSAEVRLPGDSDSLGLIFAESSAVVIAVARGLPSLTGWQLRAVNGAVLDRNAVLTQPWTEWPVLCWEFESERFCDSYEPFGAADACLLEESWGAGRGRLTTRGMSFNHRDRVLYTYEFTRMQEMSHDTGKVRGIRRRETRAGLLCAEGRRCSTSTTATVGEGHFSPNQKESGSGGFLNRAACSWTGLFKSGGAKEPGSGSSTPVNAPLNGFKSWGSHCAAGSGDGHLTLYFEADGEAVVYENQTFRRGWGPPPKGMAPAWSDAAGQAVDDPEHLEPPPACRWEGSWRVDRSAGAGADGWLFAQRSFSDRFQEEQAETDTVRRRRLVRRYTPIVPPAVLPTEHKAPEAHDEGADIERLAPILARVCPGYPMERFPNLFRLLDARNTGKVDFYALTIGLSMLGPGTVDAKLRLLHNLYDTDADEHLTREECERLATTLQEVACARRLIAKAGTLADIGVKSPVTPPLTSPRSRNQTEESSCFENLSRKGSQQSLTVPVLTARPNAHQDEPQALELSMADTRQRTGTATTGGGRGRPSRRPVPLASGMTVVVQGEEGDYYHVWWVMHQNRRGLQDAWLPAELRDGYVRKSDTVPLLSAEEGGVEETAAEDLRKSLWMLMGPQPHAKLSADDWAQAAREHPVAWHALTEAAVPLDGQGGGGDTTLALSGAGSPSPVLLNYSAPLRSPANRSARGGAGGWFTESTRLGASTQASPRLAGSLVSASPRGLAANWSRPSASPSMAGRRAHAAGVAGASMAPFEPVPESDAGTEGQSERPMSPHSAVAGKSGVAIPPNMRKPPRPELVTPRMLQQQQPRKDSRRGSDESPQDTGSAPEDFMPRIRTKPLDPERRPSDNGGTSAAPSTQDAERRPSKDSLQDTERRRSKDSALSANSASPPADLARCRRKRSR